MTVTVVVNYPVSLASSGLEGADCHSYVSINPFIDESPSHSRTMAYEQERHAFQRMLPQLLREHPGEFVAISGGQVVDHDRSQRELARRYFGQGHRGPVYMGFVGPAREARQLTPFRTRSSA
jgi:hypothetical protein